MRPQLRTRDNKRDYRRHKLRRRATYGATQNEDASRVVRPDTAWIRKHDK
jgi:hypothetical protein